MKIPKFILSLAPILILSSCGKTNNENNEEGTYTKLTNAISKLDNFTAKGTLGIMKIESSSSSSSSTEETYETKIEISKDAYYYEEKDELTSETTVQESYYKDKDGYLSQDQLDYTTNKVYTTSYKTEYDKQMKNNFIDLKVKNLKGIKGQPNWYELYNLNELGFSSFDISYFLTGYGYLNGGEEKLSCSQFALHFDGDVFDQFQILLEYTSEESEGSIYAYQYQFKLQLSKFQTTTPSKIKAYQDDENSVKLTAALTELQSHHSYQVIIDNKTETTNYYYDLNNKIIYSDFVNSYTSQNVNFYVAYKEVNNKLMMYYVNIDTQEVFKEFDFNAYFGTSNITFDYLPLMFNGVNGACYKYEGNNKYTTYYQTYDYILACLIPSDEGGLTSSSKDNFSLYLDDNNKFDYIELTTTSSTDSGSLSNTITTIKYNNFDKVVIPDYILNLGE